MWSSHSMTKIMLMTATCLNPRLFLPHHSLDWRSPFDFPCYPYSNIRTSHGMSPDTENITSSPQDNSSSCSECLLKCPDTLYLGFTPLCTDQCVVVPCTAPHETDSCDDIVCDAPDCATGLDRAGIDNLIQCCDDYHAYFTDPKPSLDPPTHFPWDSTLDALIGGDFSTQQNQHQVVASANFSQSDMPLHPLGSSPHPSLASDTTSGTNGQIFQHMHNPSFYLLNGPRMSSQPQPQQPALHTCMWGNCKAMFPSLETLVSHVNLHHLCFSPPNQVNHFDQAADYANSNFLACHWGDCQVFPTPSSVPGSSCNPIDAAMGVLASHLYHDHLGMHGGSPKLTSPSPIVDSTPETSTILLDSQLGHSEPPTPPAEHDCSTSIHICKWTGCSESFDTCEALTEHISASHVGSGKKHYDCYWGECGRNGDNGFPSKQKISRHLQSHTGHRPHQCKLCKQYFSEAATLQQHIRRHTKEKPYLCDFPGCEKAFAIAGALTIHKRTHNGQKPFKCTHCSKAFAESSNLSKHLRTHTGARPYTCNEPECGKSFARGDQLARHMGIHKKKSNNYAFTTSPVTPRK